MNHEYIGLTVAIILIIMIIAVRLGLIRWLYNRKNKNCNKLTWPDKFDWDDK